MPSGDFRITHGLLSRRALDNMQVNLRRLDALQGQVSSLKRIQRASDDPVGTVGAMRFRAGIGRNEQLDRNADDAKAWLGTADSALQGIVEQLNRVRDLAVQGRNASAGPAERAALAAEVEQVRDALVNLANTKYLDRPIFAGTARTDLAYDPAGTYLGDSGAVDRTIAPGERITVNLTGDDVFGTGATSVFAVVDALASSLRTNPSQIDQNVADLDAATDVILDRLADIGARYRRVDTMQGRTATDTLNLRSGLSEVEDVDLPKALMELRIQETAYQAALAATARAVQPSLVDFLR